MKVILYFFRDSISGIYYVMYAFVCLLLMFSIIGYLFKQKYAKVELKLNSSQEQPILEKKNKKEEKKQAKLKKEELKPNIVQTINTTPNNQSISTNTVAQESSKIQVQPIQNQNTQVNVPVQQNQQQILNNNEAIKTIPEIK